MLDPTCAYLLCCHLQWHPAYIRCHAASRGVENDDGMVGVKLKNARSQKYIFSPWVFLWLPLFVLMPPKTSSIEGRLLGSDSRHFKASSAACNIAFEEYCPSILTSITVFNFLFCDRIGFNHSTKFCCPFGRLVSSALKPVSISRSTTPKPYTSLLTYKWPD